MVQRDLNGSLIAYFAKRLRKKKKSLFHYFMYRRFSFYVHPKPVSLHRSEIISSLTQKANFQLAIAHHKICLYTILSLIKLYLIIIAIFYYKSAMHPLILLCPADQQFSSRLETLHFFFPFFKSCVMKFHVDFSVNSAHNYLRPHLKIIYFFFFLELIRCD